MLDIREVRENLTIEQIYEFLESVDAEPKYEKKNIIVSLTVCHGGDSHKLYYYDHNKMFHCYTGCTDPTFDIFELIQKVISTVNDLQDAIEYAKDFFQLEDTNEKRSFDVIKKQKDRIQLYRRINKIDPQTEEITLKEYNDPTIHYPQPIIEDWINEGITQEIMKRANIRYDPINGGIIIPHYDINGRLVGIRERTLLPENAELFGKYRPAYIHGQMYNHPLSMNLYNLNRSKENIEKYRVVIVFESEKSALQYQSFMGIDNDITVAVCGSSFLAYHYWLLYNLTPRPREIILAFDRQFKSRNEKDAEFVAMRNKLIKFRIRYKKINLSAIFDTLDLLDYKDSPTDKGKEIFMELYKHRIHIPTDIRNVITL